MRIIRQSVILLIFALLPSLVFSYINQPIDLRIQPHSYHTRLVFRSGKPFQCQQFLLHHPSRLVVDINHARFDRLLKKSFLLRTPIKNVRVGLHKNNTLRIVFDLKHDINLHAFALASRKRHPYYSLVLDLKWRPRTERSHNTRPRYYAAYQSSHPKKPIPIHLSAPEHSRKIVVVIDPGHGGKDPGATGRDGTHEKDIVLSVSKTLKYDIDHQNGFKAYLTRTGDYYLTLRQRLAVARRYKPDLFIAIHADAYRDHDAHGASVFALSSRGATSEAAHWLARKENQSELMGGVDLTDKTNLLRSVLINLSQTATIRASLRIGERIIHALGNVGRLHHRRVEQAAFVVLKSPDIPSLLVETGFISNRKEERKLRSLAYQEGIASALMQGIRSYFVHSPPRGTWVADDKFGRRVHQQDYRVVRGDSLSSVAERFNVSLSQLQRLNHLRRAGLLVGQTLQIPEK